MTDKLSEYIQANQSLQERLIASVTEISNLKQEIFRLNQVISNFNTADSNDNITLNIVQEDKSSEDKLPNMKSHPECIVDISDI